MTAACLLFGFNFKKWHEIFENKILQKFPAIQYCTLAPRVLSKMLYEDIKQ